MNKTLLRQLLALFLVLCMLCSNAADLRRSSYWGSNVGRDFCICGHSRKRCQ